MNEPDLERRRVHELRRQVEELRAEAGILAGASPRLDAAFRELCAALDEVDSEREGGPFDAGPMREVQLEASSPLPTVAELTRRAALAMDNARLYRHARRAAELRERMLGVVSHDLRNSLNAALMNADLLLEITPVFEIGSPALRQMESLRRSLDLMHRLVQDLLDADSIETGRLSLHPVRLPLPLLAREIEETFERLAKDRGIILRVEFDGVDGEVHGDLDRVMQVFSNLVSNALGFTSVGGGVRVEAEDAGRTVRFRVADTGPGIPAEELPWIFDRYWKSTLHRSAGSGLGLAIARGLVVAHGGEMTVESTLGVGTTFTFTLPRPDPDGRGLA